MRVVLHHSGYFAVPIDALSFNPFGRRDDLKCLGKSECLLSSNANQFIPCLAFPRREGAYLYFIFYRGVFIRSGKVVRRGFQARHDEHLAASKEEKSSSYFYFMYPSREGKRKEKRETRQVRMLRASYSNHRSGI